MEILPQRELPPPPSDQALNCGSSHFLFPSPTIILHFPIQFPSKLKIFKIVFFTPDGILYTIFPSNLPHLTYFPLWSISDPQIRNFHKFPIVMSVKGEKFPGDRLSPKKLKKPNFRIPKKGDFPEKILILNFRKITTRLAQSMVFVPLNSSFKHLFTHTKFPEKVPRFPKIPIFLQLRPDQIYFF